MKKLTLLTIALLCAASTITLAQEPFKPRFSLGANAVVEGGAEFSGINTKGDNPSSYGVIVRPGLSFEAQLSRHSGIETGIYYRQNITYAHYITASDSWRPETRENMLLIPVYYKYYSKILNVAAGADLIFNLESQSNSDSKMQYAFALRISKDFNLCKNLYIEPLIQGSLGNVAWWGAGLGLKYRF